MFQNLINLLQGQMKDSKGIDKDMSSSIWKIFDHCRGLASTENIRNYVFSLLLLKYLSDTKTGVAVSIPPKTDFAYLYNHRLSTDIGELINKSLHEIESANKDLLGGIFFGVDFNSENQYKEILVLLEFVQEVTRDLDDSGYGQIIDFIIEQFAIFEGKVGGEFHTPKEVSTLLSNLLNIEEGCAVYDPTCGSGSTLLSALKDFSNISLFGQEINKRTWALCKMNMILHGKFDAKIALGDTIRNPMFLSGNKELMKFDYVIANPPFALHKWGYEDVLTDIFGRFKRGLPPKSNSDYAFLSQVVASMNEDGKAAIILPIGSLSRGGNELEIRKSLIEDNLIDSVILLPSKLFFNTVIPVAILILNKKKSSDTILFINASKVESKTIRSNKTFVDLLTDSAIKQIVEIYKNKVDSSSFSKNITLDEISENDYSLDVNRYINLHVDSLKRRLPRELELKNLEEVVSSFSIASRIEDLSKFSAPLYIPKLATARCYSGFDQMSEDKLKNYIICDCEDFNVARYLCNYLNSDVGKRSRKSVSLGSTIPSVNLDTVKRVSVIWRKDSSLIVEVVNIYDSIEVLESKLEEMRGKVMFDTYSYEKFKNDFIAEVRKDPVQDLIERLPFPISSVLAQSQSEVDSHRKFRYLLNFFEAVSIFWTTILLSGISQNSSIYEEVQKDILDKTDFSDKVKRSSFGFWTILCLQLSKYIRSISKEKSDDLVDAFHCNLDIINSLVNKDLTNLFNDMVKYRNDESHEGIRTSEEYSRLCDELLSILVNYAPQFLEPFESFSLVLPIENRMSYKNGEYTTDCKVLKGGGNAFRVQKLTTSVPLESGKMYLYEDGDSRALLVIDFVKMDSYGEEIKDCPYFYNKVIDKKNDVKFVSYIGGVNTEVRYDAKDVSALIDFITNK